MRFLYESRIFREMKFRRLAEPSLARITLEICCGYPTVPRFQVRNVILCLPYHCQVRRGECCGVGEPVHRDVVPILVQGFP